MLELLNFLRVDECVAREGALVGAGLAEGGGEGLIDGMIGEVLGGASEFYLFGAVGEGGESLCSLPGAEIDAGLLFGGLSRRLSPLLKEGQMRHGVARGPGIDEDENQKSGNRDEDQRTDSTKGARGSRDVGLVGWCYFHRCLLEATEAEGRCLQGFQDGDCGIGPILPPPWGHLGFRSMWFRFKF